MTSRRQGERSKTLQRFFWRKRVATLQDLEGVLGTSGRTVLRALESEGYLTSYNQAGKYYTLPHIPSFDANGLWLHSEARFSKLGTLRRTVAVLVTTSMAGFTHEELVAVIGVRVHNTLKSLVDAGEIGRTLVNVNYLYVAADPDTASSQLSQRDLVGASAADGASSSGLPAAPPPLDLGRVVEVLVAVIRSPRDNAKQIAAHLVARGVEISQTQVEEVFTTYEIGKKKAAFRSRRSRS